MMLYACSSNPGKIQEFILASRNSGLPHITVEPIPQFSGLRPPEEDGSTFEENASTKAAYYSRFTSEMVFADDSGIEVDALGGAPSIYSARYAGADATDAANNEFLLTNLKDVSKRGARFVCVIALARAGAILATFRGEVHGEILNTPRGENGFGYDPLFFYPPLRCSFAELAPKSKFEVSHRGHALRAMFQWLSRTET